MFNKNHLILFGLLPYVFCGVGFCAYGKTKPVTQNNLNDRTSISFTLEDAILLAVRANPNVQTSKLSYIRDKFNLHVQEWEFQPHFSLQAEANFSRKKANDEQFVGSHSYNFKPTASLRTPFGTAINLSGTNPITTNYNPGLSVEIVQPLMKGFGRAVVEAALNNARDSEVISRLNIESTLRTTVTNVVKAYLDVISAERTIYIDEAALARANKSVEQTALFIKAGRKAGNEIVTVQANVATAKTQLENDTNSLQESRYALLTAIGIDPNSKYKFKSIDIHKLIKKYSLPTLAEVKNLALLNDIQYQTDLITLHGSTQRTLLSAQDNARWQLDLSANGSLGSGSGGGFNAGTNSLVNGANNSRGVGLTLKIPIDDQLLKQSVLSAKISLKQAEIALQKEKWNKETSAINGYNLLISAKRSLFFAEDAARLQEKTYNISFQKYMHGLIDSVELQSSQFQLIQSEQTLLRMQINYLRALIGLDDLLGHTLKTWNVQVRLQ